ncbi:AKAP7-NLS domain-containing protein [Fusarium sp. LHS14.1]|nr:AKAP7-NLS domain-containing protein [Fusarium sp. LHS14.1]
MPPKPVRAAPTHFVCIPLAGPQLYRSLAAFKADVTSPMSFGVPPDAVRPPGTMHLTLGVMSLKDDTIEQATEVLKSLRLRDMLSNARKAFLQSRAVQMGLASAESSSTGEAPLSITLQGLHAMQIPAKTSVLYAPPVDTDGILYKFCEQIKNTFQEAGLMAEDSRPLLLHATVINTIYVKNGRGRRREKLTIDAQDMVSRYDDYVWMENMPLEKVTLCRMGAKKIEGTDDEAYEVEAEVEF